MSSGNYTGDILLNYTIKQKQNKWSSYFNKNFADFSAKNKNFNDSKQNNGASYQDDFDNNNDFNYSNYWNNYSRNTGHTSSKTWDSYFDTHYPYSNFYWYSKTNNFNDSEKNNSGSSTNKNSGDFSSKANNAKQNNNGSTHSSSKPPVCNYDQTKLNKAYKTLGLREGASCEDLKKAYRKLILRWHPDKYKTRTKNGNENATEKEIKEAEEKFKVISNANTLIEEHLKICKKHK